MRQALGARPATSHSLRLLPWLAGLCIGLGLLIVALTGGGEALELGPHVLGSEFDLVAAALGAWLAVIITAWSAARGRFDLFEFPVWFSLNAYLQTIANVWLLQRDIVIRSPWLASRTGESMIQAVVLVGIGLTILWAAYALVIRALQRRARRASPVAHDGPLRPRATAAIWWVAWLIHFVAILVSATGYLANSTTVWMNYLSITSLVADLATFALMLHHFRQPSRRSWVWLLFACSSSIAMGLIIGTKGAVFILLYAAMSAYYATGRIRWRWVFAGFAALVVIVPTVNLFRYNLFDAGFDRSLGTTFVERGPILVRSIEQTLSQPVDALFEQSRDTFELRQGSVLEITAAVLVAHPDTLDYTGMDLSVVIAQTLIPRFIWVGKPAERPGLYLISTTYFGFEEETSLSAMGQWADSYRTGGWPFVVIWFIALGAAGAWGYHQGPASRRIGGTAFYLVTLTGILTYDRDVFSTTMRIAQFGIVLWIVAQYVIVAGRTAVASPGSQTASAVINAEPALNTPREL